MSWFNGKGVARVKKSSTGVAEESKALTERLHGGEI